LDSGYPSGPSESTRGALGVCVGGVRALRRGVGGGGGALGGGGYLRGALNLPPPAGGVS
jgi:hypothetical protein